MSEERETFGFNCFQFGDRPAAALMTIAVEKAAETFKNVAKDLNLAIEDVKNDSRKLLEDTYVDDGTTRSSRREVESMIGVKLEDGSFFGTIPAMMNKVGLKLKTIVSSHNLDAVSLAKLSDKVLGCLYNPKKDLIGI